MLKELLVPLDQAQNIDPTIIPKPDYSNVSSSIKVGDPMWCDWDNIWINDRGGNVARDADGGNPAHIADLETSFKNGIRTNEEVGAVKDRGPGFEKRYELKYSYHRADALQNLGQIGHWFNIIEATDNEWLDICSVENEPKAPKLANKEAEIVKIQVKQIEQGILTKNETSIRKRLKQLYPTRPKVSLDRIAQGIFELKDIAVRFTYWTKPKIKRWKKENFSGNFEIEGDKDKSRNMFGFTTKIGGVYRTHYRAKMKYAETGIKSYVNCFSGQITKTETLEKQRQSIIDEYVALRIADYKVYGKDICFLIINGFFPQEDTEIQKHFFNVDVQKDIEKRIKREIKKL
tara:strand:+ start:443 stop:1480 length:1038 start_codon:yes stop_codon:yes gene_type:complete